MKPIKMTSSRNSTVMAALVVFALLWSAALTPASAQNFSTATMANLANVIYSISEKKNYTNYVPQGFNLLKRYRDKSGVNAAVFEHTATGTIALSIAGTQPSDIRDVLADLGIGQKEINTAMRYLVDDMVQEAKWIPGAAKKGVQATMHKLWGLDKNLKILKCPKGSFLDIGTYACWTCPKGTHRTVFDVRGGKACERRPQTSFAKADKKRKVKIGKKGCKKGEFWDKKGGTWGACWDCPSGYKRGVHPVDSSKACLKISGLHHYKASKVDDSAVKSHSLADVTAAPSKKLDNQVNAALAIVDHATTLKKRNGQPIKLGEIQVTGHSLGGFLAQVVTVRRKVKIGVAFNPPGARAYLKVNGNPANLTNHSRKHDVVGRFGRHVGKLYLYSDVAFNWKNIKKIWPNQNHSSETLKVDLAKGMKPK